MYVRQQTNIFLPEEVYANSRYFAELNFLLKLAYSICLCILKLLNSIADEKKAADDGQHCFPELRKYVPCNKAVVSQHLLSIFKEHLLKLTDWFAKENVEKFA